MVSRTVSSSSLSSFRCSSSVARVNDADDDDDMLLLSSFNVAVARGRLAAGGSCSCTVEEQDDSTVDTFAALLPSVSDVV